MPLRIAQVSTYDTSGGAARSAYRLHRGLIARGHQCRMLVARGDSGNPTVQVLPISEGGAFGKMRSRLRRRRIRRDLAPYRSTRPDWPERFSEDRSWWDWRNVDRLASLDVVNLHWVAGFIDYTEFFRAVPPRVPIVWTLRDMNVFTGGCHYDEGCDRYLTQCGACPQLGSTDEHDLSHQVWKRKRALFENLHERRLHIVTPSRWMADEVGRSPLLRDRFDVSVIPNGVNTEEFAPRDRAAARAVLGIPPQSQVVLFVAYSVAPRRKGFTLLVDALRGLSGHPNLFAVSVGAGTPAVDLPVPALHLGKISQNRLLSLVYSAADVYVIPSLQDNLPSTVLESMACGTPVVGFEVGGIPEMVRPGVTGDLAPVGDVGALSALISGLLADPERRRRMSESCLGVVHEEYDMATYVSRYEAMYEALAEVR